MVTLTLPMRRPRQQTQRRRSIQRSSIGSWLGMYRLLRESTSKSKLSVSQLHQNISRVRLPRTASEFPRDFISAPVSKAQPLNPETSEGSIASKASLDYLHQDFAERPRRAPPPPSKGLRRLTREISTNSISRMSSIRPSSYDGVPGRQRRNSKAAGSSEHIVKQLRSRDSVMHHKMLSVEPLQQRSKMNDLDKTVEPKVCIGTSQAESTMHLGPSFEPLCLPNLSNYDLTELYGCAAFDLGRHGSIDARPSLDYSSQRRNSVQTQLRQSQTDICEHRKAKRPISNVAASNVEVRERRFRQDVRQPCTASCTAGTGSARRTSKPTQHNCKDSVEEARISVDVSLDNIKEVTYNVTNLRQNRPSNAIVPTDTTYTEARYPPGEEHTQFLHSLSHVGKRPSENERMVCGPPTESGPMVSGSSGFASRRQRLKNLPVSRLQLTKARDESASTQQQFRCNWKPHSYLQGPIRLPTFSVLERNDSAAAFPSEITIDSRKDAQSQEEISWCDDICGFFDSYEFDQVSFAGDILSGRSKDRRGRRPFNRDSLPRSTDATDLSLFSTSPFAARAPNGRLTEKTTRKDMTTRSMIATRRRTYVPPAKHRVALSEGQVSSAGFSHHDGQQGAFASNQRSEIMPFDCGHSPGNVLGLRRRSLVLDPSGLGFAGADRIESFILGAQAASAMPLLQTAAMSHTNSETMSPSDGPSDGEIDFDWGDEIDVRHEVSFEVKEIDAIWRWGVPAVVPKKSSNTNRFARSSRGRHGQRRRNPLIKIRRLVATASGNT